MNPPVRERYNEKARGSLKKKKKQKKHGDAAVVSEQVDANAEIVTPKSQEQKEVERKEKLRQELVAEAGSKLNSKKKKRLDKYIEKKLKQEERGMLFEKLTKSQAQLPNAFNLQSSSTLGTGKALTHQERMDKQEDKEVRQIMQANARPGKRKRNGDISMPPMVDESDEDELDKDAVVDGIRQDYQQHDDDGDVGKSPNNPVVIVDSGFATSVVASTSTISTGIGSALRHNPDGSVVAPRISKRKATGSKNAFTSWKTGADSRLASQLEAASDSSFDSSDSAYDSPEEADTESDGAFSDWGGIRSSHASGSGAEIHENEESLSNSESDSDSEPARKRLGFKAWALQQVSTAKGYVAPPADPDSDPSPPMPHSKRRKTERPSVPGEMRGPLGEDLHLPQTAFTRHLQDSAHTPMSTRKSVVVVRPADVEAARLLLPVVAEEQPIMEAVLLNSVVIICGETGSGKTTQVPQFLYEAGFGTPGSENPGMIGVTQPRRVAAMSMASRVAQELALPATRVSYQIRYDATVSPTTAIKFMTDGVLLRELATDFLLKKYSVVIIDEAHERSMNTDILIGVLSRVVRLREEMWKEGRDNVKPLRLIIMSATLRVSDFAENTTLFTSPPPIISVPARQHPVTIHFARRTVPDYVSEALRKTCKIHSRLPPGGILIFLTGQNEITGVCRKLESRYGLKALAEKRKARAARGLVRNNDLGLEDGDESKRAAVVPAQADVEAEDIDLGTVETSDLAFDIDGEAADADTDADALDSDEASGIDEELGIDADESDMPMHVVPLYALLPSDKQMRVFQPPPPGTRLVVVSTNVAETSLTIPGIRYVVDCGRAKERRYDIANGIQSFQVSWVSKASAAQRAGRAGRTGPGHCYRLYSSALYENYFEQFSTPEILRMPIEGVVLQMKSMHIDAVINFPFPTPPDRSSLRKAETLLTHLGALTARSSFGTVLGGEITEVGKAMALFPLSPRFSRMLVSGRQHGCLPYVITIVSALSVGDPFLREEALEKDGEESDNETDELSHLTSDAMKLKEMRRIRRRAFFQSQQIHASLGDSTSDIFRILSVVGAYEYAGGGHTFCSEHFVRPKAMEEIHKLRAQINHIVQTNFPDMDTGFVANLRPPSNLQLKVLRQLIAAGFIDQVAVRRDLIQPNSTCGEQYATSKGVAYQALGINEDVFIHPSSVIANKAPPDFVVYLEVVRTSRVWVKGLTVINAAWIASLGKSLCTFSKPIKNKDGIFMMIPHFGPAGWELPAIKASSE